MWYFVILKWLLLGGTATLFLTLGISFGFFFAFGGFIETQLVTLLTNFLSNSALSQIVIFMLVNGGFIDGLKIYLGFVVAVAIVKSVRGFITSNIVS